MQIRIIIEHKYSYSHQKQICNYVKKEKREFLYLFFLQIKRETPKFQEPIPDGKGINKKKLSKKRRGEGQLSLERKGGIEALIRTR
jgi:hypothetical protein